MCYCWVSDYTSSDTIDKYISHVTYVGQHSDLCHLTSFSKYWVKTVCFDLMFELINETLFSHHSHMNTLPPWRRHLTNSCNPIFSQFLPSNVLKKGECGYQTLWWLDSGTDHQLRARVNARSWALMIADFVTFNENLKIRTW